VRPERSPQQLDPLGTLAAWTLTPLAGAAAFGYALLSTAWHRHQQTHPAFTVAALTLLFAAIVVLIVCAAPRRAPLRRTAFIVVLVLAASAAALSTGATWGADRLVQDDWGQISFALLLVSMTQLRPAIDLAVASCAGAVAIGALAAAPAAQYAIAVGPVIYAIVAATPILLLGLGATTYARVMVRTTERWQRSARDGMVRLAPDVRATARRTVRQEQITILNAGAVPLFTRLIETGSADAADIEEASSVALQLRRHALRLVRTGWLDDAVRRAGLPDAVISDPDGAIENVSVDHRVAVGAFVVELARLGEDALGTDRRVDATPVHVTAAADPQTSRVRLVISAPLLTGRRMAARALMPYVSVLRVVSHDARLRIGAGTVTLGFSYDTV